MAVPSCFGTWADPYGEPPENEPEPSNGLEPDECIHGSTPGGCEECWPDNSDQVDPIGGETP